MNQFPIFDINYFIFLPIPLCYDNSPSFHFQTHVLWGHTSLSDSKNEAYGSDQ